MTDSLRGYLLHVFHRNQGGQTSLLAVGRLENGQTFALADTRQRPAFYLRGSDAERVGAFCRGAGGEVEDTALTTMDGEPVVRVAVARIPQLRQLADGLHQQQVRTYEADLAFPRQYLIDRGLRGLVRIRGPWRPGHGVDRVYLDPDLEPDDWEPELSVLALDIETLPDASQVLACSLVGWSTDGAHSTEEIHLVGAPVPADPPQVRCHPAERDLLEALAARVRALDPDVLTGWNLVDFDLTVLQKRCRVHGLSFNLGRSRDESWYQEGDVWGGSRVVVYGRQVLDAMHLVRATVQRFEDHRLGTVARAVLGRDKVLSAEPGEAVPDLILSAYRSDRAAFADYCLEDARLVRDILEKEGLVRLSLRRGTLTGLPLERAWGSVAAFDFLYISQLRRRGMVAPTTGVDRFRLAGSPGGLVMPAKAGLYRHVFVFDFKSLYPSIIRTFNIDPLSHLRARLRASGGTGPADLALAAEATPEYQTEPGVSGDLIRAPNGALFTRDPGILPQLLEGFFAERAAAQRAGDRLASLTYKLVMNSFYGVLATESCRFAEGALAGAITGFGHYLLRWAKALLEDGGRGTVLYGDTDSLFVDPHLPGDVSAAQAHRLAEELRAWINQAVAAHVRARFDLPCHLDLEFEKYYRRFFLPPSRGDADRARAKGYAGLRVEADGAEEVEIVGMEAVRRDWTDLAHQVQRDLLGRVFRDAPAVDLEARVLQWVDALRRGECDGDLVYRKALRKSVDGYTRTLPPHVAAARLLDRPAGTIRYVVTRDGPQPVGHVTAPLDYDHYVEKQLRPIVRTIGQVCDLDVEVALGGTRDLFRPLAAASPTGASAAV